MVDIQMQIQDLVKLTNAVNNQLADIKIILLQAENIYKMKISENMLLANKLDKCKRKGVEIVDKDIKTL